MKAFRQRALPDVEGFGFPDHIRNRGGACIAQEHGMLGFVTEGGGNLYIMPGADVGDDVGRISLV